MANKIKAVFIDLSGTIHIDNTIIPGAIEALKKLRSTNAKIKFVTNTTKESKSSLHNRLINLGFDIKKDEIFSSLAAARELVIAKKFNPFLIIDPAAMEDFEDLIKTNEESNAVVVGLAPDKFNYEKLNEAFRLLMKGASLIAIHEGRYYKRPDGLALGPGGFIKLLEYSANVKAEVVGKPTEKFFTTALDGISPSEAVMIGDDVRDDVGGAQAVGIRGILVKTGKYRPDDEKLITPPPTKVVSSFVQAVDEIMNNMS
ncbi:GSCOCG00001675001-RA-CDS [Cotesia congregata]|uniref:Haloacid dehalogenase-like hydrolase domain-containing protein 2 n=1 Tax=Cotesia congregata TaxID=51543 RepID=A0A8J2MTB8_COTCN|nr:GSCOCG00001675001-RA-CDS [Cotesia congregata]CAG5107006.1 Similar to HDHD2: Haloacid dehalogenase-like hydrolase domain-containing protein 2 (Pongo abelii) [Cotesia congregata]